MGKSLSLDEFKAYINEKKTNKKDHIDMKNGRMTVYRDNLPKYLEKYMCQNEEDLDNTLYRSFGIWLKVVD